MKSIVVGMTTLARPIVRAFPAPLMAQSVDWPVVNYGRITALNFTLDDGEDENPGWGRVTFEKFDALRICRGEYLPYEVSREAPNSYSWIWTVDDSPWLLERYTYEKKHYGTSYGFGGDVEEMIRDFSHYVFSFHDQYVEVLCDGLWFEKSAVCLGDNERGPDHPANDLPESAVVDEFTAHGITCQIRKNPRPIDELLAEAAYGTQKLYQFAALLDEDAHPSWTVTLRVRKGKLEAPLAEYFGRVEQRYTTIPDLARVRARIEQWLFEVSERRKAMGKANSVS